MSEVFAIDVYAYHIISHVDADTAKNWAQDDVIERWRKLFGGGILLERYLAGQCNTEAEIDAGGRDSGDLPCSDDGYQLVYALPLLRPLIYTFCQHGIDLPEGECAQF